MAKLTRPRLLIVVIVAIVAALAAAGACTPHAPLRTTVQGAAAAPISTSVERLVSDAAHRDTVSHTSIEDHQRFRVGIVEFDDQGQFWNRAQFDQVIADLRATYERSDGVQVLVFVHGWKHSSGVCDSNLACFRELLANLADREDTSGRPVYGVYVGWRGLSVRLAGVKELSFWGRKATAHRVGSADVVELLSTLETLHRQERRASPRTRLTTIGHSFGAAAVFSAIEGSLKERLATYIATPQDQRQMFVGFGTLTLLVNPAFEASVYEGIDHMLRAHAGLFNPRNPRVLVTVASEGDGATRYLFPLGRVISTSLQRSRDFDQRRQMTTTVGNYEPYMTHQLSPVDEASAASPESDAECSCRTQVREAFAQEASLRASQFAVESDEEYFGNTKLTPLNSHPPSQSPFIVARADRRVIADHNDIWSRPFVEFMAGLIARTDALVGQ